MSVPRRLKSSCNSLVMSKRDSGDGEEITHRSFCPIFWKLTKCRLTFHESQPEYCPADLKESRTWAGAPVGVLGAFGCLRITTFSCTLLFHLPVIAAGDCIYSVNEFSL